MKAMQDKLLQAVESLALDTLTELTFEEIYELEMAGAVEVPIAPLGAGTEPTHSLATAPADNVYVMTWVPHSKS